jgi:hypothetical protein
MAQNMLTFNEFKALEHQGWYRVHFEGRVPWNAFVFNAGPEPKLRYPGGEAPPQDFPVIADLNGHVTVPKRENWRRLTKVTRPRGEPPELDSAIPSPEPEPPSRVMVSIRVPADQLAEIDRRAEAASSNRTDYMIRAALGGDPMDQRLAVIERRLGQLEHGNRHS